MSHTPGPWNWRLDAGTWYLAPGVLITDYTDGTPDGDLIDRGNACLIAAAPDLLKVAIWAEAALAPFSKEPAEKSGIANLRAAIAKATGAA